MLSRQNIISLLNDIECMSTNKKEVLERAISERLSKSLESYESSMSYSLDYLQRKEAIKVMRRINKE